MTRRLIVASALLLAAGTASAASASDLADQVIARLEQLGFRDISVSRTLLGRTRILADQTGRQREIVLDPRTGEVLRDLWLDGGDDHGDHKGGDDDDDHGGDDHGGHGGGNGGED